MCDTATAVAEQSVENVIKDMIVANFRDEIRLDNLLQRDLGIGFEEATIFRVKIQSEFQSCLLDGSIDHLFTRSIGEFTLQQLVDIVVKNLSGTVNNQTIYDKIVEMIVDIFRDQVEPESRLCDDLHVSSLDQMDMMAELGEKFGIPNDFDLFGEKGDNLDGGKPEEIGPDLTFGKFVSLTEQAIAEFGSN